MQVRRDFITSAIVQLLAVVKIEDYECMTVINIQKKVIKEKVIYIS